MNKNTVLIVILFIGLLLRLYGINWDQGQHLHPDERFLTMVGGAMRPPLKIIDYFNPKVSTLNPYNIGHQFYVYGTFPLTITKTVASIIGMDNYNDFTFLGRLMSAFFDTLTIFIVYKLVQLFETINNVDNRLKYIAAFFYAIAVLPIQQAHFFTMDVFLSFFLMASVYFSVHYYYSKSLRNFCFSAVFFGLAMGTKINAVYILPLILFFLCYKNFTARQWGKFFFGIGFFGIIFYLSLRLADPRFFENANIFDLRPNKQFITSLSQLNTFSSSKTAQYFPPAIQWYHITPFWFSLANIALYGLGMPLLLLTMVGSIFVVKEKKIEYIAILVWMTVFYLYQSTRFSPSMRYFIFLYPFFAILAAFAYQRLFIIKEKNKRKFAQIIVLITLLIWPVSFMAIYTRPHSRITASVWIHQNIPENAYLAEEHWDDWLPLPVSDGYLRQYKGEQMPVFNPDTDEKWQIINATLQKADYYIITSGRAYQHIINLPQMYPKMSQFYKDLFAERLSFKKEAEFTSYPTFPPYCIANLPCWSIADQYAEEAFTVFDHPKVTIFKKI